MTEIIEKEKIIIEDMIYEVRGVQVMLDSDIAKLYQVETKRVNEAVKTNPDKFPERFSWVVTNEETKDLRSKISTLEIKGQGKYRKYATRVFTEQGLYMLATILKSKVATEVSIAIMDAFVKMRHYINYNKTFLPHKFMLLEKRVDDNTKRINELFDKFDPKDIVKDYIFFDGDFYDSYSLLLDIFNESQDEIIIIIIIIDNYVGKELLDILKKIDKRIVIVSKNIDETLKKKYESQYDNIVFINNNSFHDRFIILDRNKLYSCGASFKDLCKKCFAINEFKEKIYLNEILKVFLARSRSNNKNDDGFARKVAERIKEEGPVLKNKLIRCSRIAVDCVPNDPVDIRCGGPEYLGFDFNVKEEETEKMKKFITVTLANLNIPYTIF